MVVWPAETTSCGTPVGIDGARMVGRAHRQESAPTVKVPRDAQAS